MSTRNALTPGGRARARAEIPTHLLRGGPLLAQFVRIFLRRSEDPGRIARGPGLALPGGMRRFNLSRSRVILLTAIVSLFLAGARGDLSWPSFGGGTARAAEKRASAPLRRLPPPPQASAEVRAALQSRMVQHGKTMSSLVNAVVLLDRPTIATLAIRIADEEVVARAEGGGTDKLREVLPAAFLGEQDALKSAARELAKAAAEHQPDTVLADRFGVLTHTCVTCHSIYLGWHVERLP